MVHALTLLILAASVLQAQEISKPRLTVLDNGMRVITVEDHRSPLVAVVWSARVGDSAEPADFAGNSHFLEHLLLFRGTDKYPGNEIGERVDSVGGYFNGQTWRDWTTFEIEEPSSRLDEALDMQEQMMFHGAFAGSDFELEKKAVFEELRTRYDQPYGYLGDTSGYTMYDGETFYSRSTIGSIAIVQAATADRVRRYYRSYYVPNNIALVVAGDFDTDATLAKVRARFGAYKAKAIAPTPYSPLHLKPGVTTISEKRHVGKAYFLAAFEGPDAASPDWAPYQVLAEYLSDGKTAPLREELVEKRKLLEDVAAEADPRRYAGGWQAFYGEGEPAKLADGVGGLLQEFTKVRRSGVARERLELTKRRMIAQHRVESESLYESASELTQADAEGDYRQYADFEQRIDRVTPEDVWTVAKKYLDPSHFYVHAIFPEETVPADFAEKVKAAAAREAAAQGGALAQSRLANGATLLFDARPGAPVESFSAAIDAGERDDGKTVGISKAVSAMITRLTAKHSRTELQQLLDREGITLSSKLGKDGTVITMTAPAGKTEVMGPLLLEILDSPAFSESEWKAAQRESIAAVTEQEDDPEEVAHSTLQKLLYPDTPYGADLPAEKAGLESLTPAQLSAFFKKYYRPDRIAIAYSGPASRETVEKALSGRLATAVNPTPARINFVPPEIQDIQRAAKPMPGKDQVQLYWMWPGPAVDSDDWILLTLAARAFGGDLDGRLWRLRQKEGLAYSVWFISVPLRDRPLVGIYMATAKDKYPAATAALDREIAKAVNGISQAELDRVKVSQLAALEIADSKSDSRSRRHAEWWLLGHGPDYRARLERVVKGATLDQVNRVVRETILKDRFFKAEAGALN